MAHFFGLLARFRGQWWIGDTGRREVLAIQAYLSQEWQHLMRDPLRMMEEETIYVE